MKQTEIAKELNITPVLNKITGIQKKLVATYKQNAPDRLPRILNYRPTG